MSEARRLLTEPPFNRHTCFTLWRLDGSRKVPVHHTGTDRHSNENPAPLLNAEYARGWLQHCVAAGIGHDRRGETGYIGIGVRPDPLNGLACIDLDNSVNEAGEISPGAMQIIAMFPGALVEVSNSGRGLHLWFSYAGPSPGRHGRFETPFGIAEVYGEGQFIAEGLQILQGHAQVQLTRELWHFLQAYLPSKNVAARDANWTTDADDGWMDVRGDDEIRAELDGPSVKRSGREAFGGAHTVQELWASDGNVTGDRSQSRMALLAKLVYLCGGNCEQVYRLAQGHPLAVKDDRDDLLRTEILKARALFQVWRDKSRPSAPAAARLAGATGSRPLIHDASELLMTKPTPVAYAVNGWIPEGLMLLVASPKLGKSTLILQIAVAMANGGTFWGYSIAQAGVLMIDLETNPRRLRRKLEQAGITTLPPGRLQYATAWPRGNAGVEEIARTLDLNPAIKLVVIDTLQRFRDTSSGRQNAYAADYEALAPLQQLCRDRAGLAIVCVHHKRKAAVDDPVDSINGSAAIAGAADAIWIMSRKLGDYTLHIQARDWEREEDEFHLQRAEGQWRLLDGPQRRDSETEVIDRLRASTGLTAPNLGAMLGITRQSAYERLCRLRDAGSVTLTDGVWKANP